MPDSYWENRGYVKDGKMDYTAFLMGEHGYTSEQAKQLLDRIDTATDEIKRLQQLEKEGKVGSGKKGDPPPIGMPSQVVLEIDDHDLSCESNVRGWTGDDESFTTWQNLLLGGPSNYFTFAKYIHDKDKWDARDKGWMFNSYNDWCGKGIDLNKPKDFYTPDVPDPLDWHPLDWLAEWGWALVFVGGIALYYMNREYGDSVRKYGGRAIKEGMKYSETMAKNIAPEDLDITIL